MSCFWLAAANCNNYGLVRKSIKHVYQQIKCVNTARPILWFVACRRARGFISMTIRNGLHMAKTHYCHRYCVPLTVNFKRNARGCCQISRLIFHTIVSTFDLFYRVCQIEATSARIKLSVLHLFVCRVRVPRHEPQQYVKCYWHTNVKQPIFPPNNCLIDWREFPNLPYPGASRPCQDTGLQISRVTRAVGIFRPGLQL